MIIIEVHWHYHKAKCLCRPVTVCAQEECARILLFRGVDKSLSNIRNRTASQEATLGGYKELAELIDSFRSEDVGQSALSSFQ